MSRSGGAASISTPILRRNTFLSFKATCMAARMPTIPNSSTRRSLNPTGIFSTRSGKGKIVVYDRDPREHGRPFAAISFQSSRSRQRICPAVFQRDGFGLFARYAADERLAGRGKISAGVFRHRISRMRRNRVCRLKFSIPDNLKKARLSVPPKAESLYSRTRLILTRPKLRSIGYCQRKGRRPIRKSSPSSTTCANRCAKIFPWT